MQLRLGRLDGRLQVGRGAGRNHVVDELVLLAGLQSQLGLSHHHDCLVGRGQRVAARLAGPCRIEGEGICFTGGHLDQSSRQNRIAHRCQHNVGGRGRWHEVVEHGRGVAIGSAIAINVTVSQADAKVGTDAFAGRRGDGGMKGGGVARRLDGDHRGGQVLSGGLTADLREQSEQGPLSPGEGDLPHDRSLGITSQSQGAAS